MTARDLDELLQEQTAYERKCQIISEIAAYIDGMSNQAAYREQIDLLFAALEKSARDLESGGGLDDVCAKEIVGRVSDLKREQEKYQVWLLGEAADCAPVEKLLDVSQVHLLGTVRQISDGQRESDYIIICSQYENIAGIHWFGKVRLLRFDLFRLMNEISPEATYQQIKNKIEVTTAAGVVCGMSYEQKGICYERLARDIMCLAGPSQDLYTDYYRFLWAYDEITDRQKRRMEYCIIGMSAYRLWWDLSRGSQSLRVLGFYPQTKKLHHLDWAEDAAEAWEDQRICEKLMGQDFLERDFLGRFPGIAEICETKREEIYTPSKEQRKEDAKSIERIFHKPYPETYKENLAVLERWLEFLQKNNIKAVFLFMPFPAQFCELTSGEMKRQTYLVLENLCRKYGADLIDLGGDQTAFTDADFFDWSHLNAAGAAKVTRYLNEYLMRETKQEDRMRGLHLRPADAQDCRFLYELRNDPLVRASSFHTEEIPYEQHQKWYEQKRKNENCRIYILEDAGAPVGQVRADRDERGESAEISYAIAEWARGNGYASWMLAAAEEQLSEKGFCRELLAEVKNDNIASQKVFQKLGYEEQREDYGFSYRRAIGQNADGK